MSARRDGWDWPGVSVLVPTFARTALLAECLQSFESQAYPGQREMIIINDCPAQRLAIDLPGVTVLNLPRFPTLGEKRNALAALARFPLLQWWDDDDIHFDDHLRAGVESIRADEPAGRVIHEYVQRPDRSVTVRVSAWLHTVTMRADAFAALGRFAPLDRGQDVDFVRRAVRAGWFRGAWHHGAHHAPTMLYRQATGYERCGTHGVRDDHTNAATARLAHGAEPRGVVRVLPAWRVDYRLLVRNARRPEPVMP